MNGTHLISNADIIEPFLKENDNFPEEVIALLKEISSVMEKIRNNIASLAKGKSFGKISKSASLLQCRAKDGTIHEAFIEKRSLINKDLILRSRKELRSFFGLFSDGQIQTDIHINHSGEQYFIGCGYQDRNGAQAQSMIELNDPSRNIKEHEPLGKNGEFEELYYNVRNISDHLVIHGKNVIDYLKEFLESLKIAAKDNGVEL